MSMRMLREELRRLARKEKAEVLSRYFKTNPGEYAAGDIFIGVMVPQLRVIAKKYAGTQMREIGGLLKSSVHEERFAALLLLIDRFSRGGVSERKSIYLMYMANLRHINNWDLVDLSAPKIAGRALFDKSREPLYKLAASPVLWERRIAIVSTLYFIRHRRFADTFRIAVLLLGDEEDLIHKAAGWMLREVSKQDREAAENFLNRYYQTMPRTMLRYAIERLPPARRKAYLRGKI